MINHYFGVITNPDELSSYELQDEIYLLIEEPFECITFDFGTMHSSGRVEWVAQKGEAVYWSRLGRGGVCTGADAVWSNADDINDLVERVLGIKGKEVSA